MSKANPTRPHATAADVEQRIAELQPVHQKRLKQYGYNVNDLRRVCADEKQADAVDALLAILTDRSGYEHDQHDLDQATKVAKTLGADTTPREHLIMRKKLTPFYGGARAGMPPSMAGKKTTGKDVLAGLGICLGVIVVIALAFVLFK